MKNIIINKYAKSTVYQMSSIQSYIEDLGNKIGSMQEEIKEIEDFFSKDANFQLNVTASEEKEEPNQKCEKDIKQEGHEQEDPSSNPSNADSGLISEIEEILDKYLKTSIKVMKRRYKYRTICEFINNLTYKPADFSNMINKLEKSMNELLKIRGAYIQRRADTLRKLRHIRRQQRNEFSNYDLIDSVVDEIDSSMKLLKVKLNSIPPKESENNIIDQLSQLFMDSNE